VEFTSLIECGRRCGLAPLQFTDQSRFLLEAGAELIAEIAARDAGRPSAERNAVHQLIHPSLMGRTFKVLLQQKE
jgi:SAM-dependent MidA family methyltransferase